MSTPASSSAPSSAAGAASGSGAGVGAFDELPADAALAGLTVCLHSSQWANAVLAGRPYASIQALTGRAMTAARDLSEPELALALAAHPRIGERPAGTDPAASLSRAEQSAVVTDTGTAAALHQANVDYEARFGHVFLIRAAGRDTAEILAEARRRLANDAADEAVEVREQLGQIAVRRLEQWLQRLPPAGVALAPGD